MVYLCVFIFACNSADFMKREGPNVSYQICPNNTDIFRLRRTIAQGAPTVQLFDKKGKLMQTITIAPQAPIMITKVENKLIQITYFVGSGDDLKFFLPWFQTNKYNPDHIGLYRIHYTYEISNEYKENKSTNIDSLSIDKKKKIVSVFLKGNLITALPIDVLFLSETELTSYDQKTSIHSSYIFVGKSLFKDYLQGILSI